MTHTEANAAYLATRFAPPLTDVPRLIALLADPQWQDALLGHSVEERPVGASVHDVDQVRDTLRQLLYYHGLLEFSIYAGFLTVRPLNGPDQEILAHVNYRSFAEVKLQYPLPEKLRRHLGGHWTERRARTPLELVSCYRVLTLVGEAGLSQDLATVARLGSMNVDNRERRASFLEVLGNPDALAVAFKAQDATETAELVLLTFRTMEQLDAILGLISELREADEDAAGQVASLYALLTGPMNHFVGRFLTEAARALESAEAQLRTTPLADSAARPRRAFSADELIGQTPEEKLLEAIFGPVAKKKPFKVRLKEKPPQDAAQNEP